MEKTLCAMISNSITRYWNLPAMADYEDEAITYGDVANRISRLHALFSGLKIKPGDKIALLGKNSLDWAVAYLATVSFGAVVVPILPDFKTNDIHHIVNHSDALILFTGRATAESLDETKMLNLGYIFALDNLELIYSGRKNAEKTIKKITEEYRDAGKTPLSADSFRSHQAGPDDLACLSYTSGTTGFSKGVMLSHANLQANVLFAQKNMPLKPGDRILSFLPLAHAYGCAFEFLFPFSSGCFITFLGRTPTPRTIIEAFSAIKPQLVLSVPLIMEKIYKKQIKPVLESTKLKLLTSLPPLKKIVFRKIRRRLVELFGGNFHEVVIGGAALNAEVELFLKAVEFPFTSGYGMTECGPLISYSNWKITRTFSVGRPVDGMEVRIASPDPVKVVGEILTRGTNVFHGYYKNPETTAETIDQDGWLHTGDLGVMDQDGFVYIKGRCKNMILGSSGQNIYPEEIEAKLNNLPYVGESLLVESEGKLIALVYPDLELVDQQGLQENELKALMEKNRQSLNADLPAFSRITRIDLYPEEFEKTATKKIKRFLYSLGG
jgi:long-chain acyl-CoA synthetase